MDYKVFLKQYSSIVLFGFLLVIPYRLQWVCIISLMVNSFFFTKKWKITFNFFLYSIPFFVFILSLLHFNTKDFGFVERSISFILIPLSLFTFCSNIDNNDFRVPFSKSLLYKSFFWSSLFYIIIAFLNYYFNTKSWWKSFLDPETLRNSIRYIPKIELDPIYVSIFFAISIVFSFKLFFDTRRYVYAIGGMVYLIFVFILSSKMTLISLVFVLLAVSLRFFKRKRLLFLIISFFILFLFKNERAKELFNLKTYSEKVDNTNSTNIRFGLTLSSFELLKENWLWGMGFSSTKQKVSKIFIEKYYGNMEYNTHNQYLSIWLSTGILGILLFMYYLYFNFKLAVYKNDTVFLSVLIIIALGLLTENLLERQFGVILIAYLISFFGFVNLIDFEKDSNIRNKLLP